MEKTTEKRTQSRMKLNGYLADLADGPFVYAGTVEDISVGGLRLSDLPHKFEMKSWKYTLVVSGGPDSVSYKMTVCPCWRRKNEYSADVGFRIAEAPPGWKAFVQRLLPKQTRRRDEEICVWDQYSGSETN